MQNQKPAVRAEEHLGLVHLCANRFRERGIEYEELYSAGCLGLCKAAQAFSPDRGVCFSTYAVPVIMGEIRRLFRDGGSIHVGRRLRALARQAQQTAELLRQKHGREPNISEIAAEMACSEEEAAEALCAAQPVCSLTAYTETGELQTDIPVASHEADLQEHLALEQVLSLLSPQDRELIRLRYECTLTQSKTAERLHMTQVQVSRREKKILLFLRSELEK